MYHLASPIAHLAVRGHLRRIQMFLTSTFTQWSQNSNVAPLRFFDLSTLLHLPSAHYAARATTKAHFGAPHTSAGTSSFFLDDATPGLS
jgi:hypothetical protein